KSSCSFAPAFSHVWTTTGSTNGIQFVFIYQTSELGVLFSGRKLYTKPFRFRLFFFIRSRMCFCSHGFFLKRQRYKLFYYNVMRNQEVNATRAMMPIQLNRCILMDGFHFFGMCLLHTSP